MTDASFTVTLNNGDGNDSTAASSTSSAETDGNVMVDSAEHEENDSSAATENKRERDHDSDRSDGRPRRGRGGGRGRGGRGRGRGRGQRFQRYHPFDHGKRPTQRRRTPGFNDDTVEENDDASLTRDDSQRYDQDQSGREDSAYRGRRRRDREPVNRVHDAMFSGMKDTADILQRAIDKSSNPAMRELGKNFTGEVIKHCTEWTSVNGADYAETVKSIRLAKAKQHRLENEARDHKNIIGLMTQALAAVADPSSQHEDDDDQI